MNTTQSKKLVTFLVVIGGAAGAAPLVAASSGNAWVRIVDMALLYVLLALGLNIVVGYAGLLDLGYVAFFAVGAYLFALLGSPHLAEAFPWIAAHVPERAAHVAADRDSARAGGGGLPRRAAGCAHAEAARRPTSPS
jgi:branched-chain amino acid transport system permease protein